jgi:uncharacterized short protein YbdD (DUF466 family)
MSAAQTKYRSLNRWALNPGALKRWAQRGWVGLREWCGDSAYERYVQAQRPEADKTSLLTPTEFYVEQLNRRYSRPNRCC